MKKNDLDTNDELRPYYKVDYSKSRPNRFAGRKKIITGARRDSISIMNKQDDPEYLAKLDDYELEPHYDFDYSKAKPNRFAGRVILTNPDAMKPKLDRITFDPKVMSGRACIRGMRITVSVVLGLASEMTTEEIIREYPYLEPEDIKQSLLYASLITRDMMAQ
jgi:uncharacterized protein (DUF433 family)